MSSQQLKISLFVHDLSKNPIGRADTFIRVLTKIGYIVEIIGFTIYKNEIWEPYAKVYDYKTIHIKDSLPSLLNNIYKLAQLATGEVIIAFKPIATSFLPALIASKMGRSKILLIDIEDDEFGINIPNYKRLLKILFKDTWHCISPMTNFIMNFSVKRCSGITVVSKKLQEYYGGKIILTTPDMDLYNPNREELNKQKCRDRWNLPKSGKLVLFVGSPAPHKGLSQLSRAIVNMSDDIYLVLVGNDNHDIFEGISRRLKARCIRIPPVSRFKTPELLIAADMIVLPQIKGTFADAQVPAKLIDAMAMKVPIVTTDVSDMRELMGYDSNNKRGWIADGHEFQHLKNKIKAVIDNPDEAFQRGENARQYLVKHHSDEKIANCFLEMLSSKEL